MYSSNFKESIKRGATFLSMALVSATMGFGSGHAMEFEPWNGEHWGVATRQAFSEIEAVVQKARRVKASMGIEEIDVSLAPSEASATLSPEILKQIGHMRLVPALGFSSVGVASDGGVVVWIPRAMLTISGDPSEAISQFSTVVNGDNLRADLQDVDDPHFIHGGKKLVSFFPFRKGTTYAVTSATRMALNSLMFMYGFMRISEKDSNLASLLARFKASLAADKSSFEKRVASEAR